MRIYNRRSGFSLIELTIVLFIVVGLLAIVAPMAGTYTSDAQVTTTNATMAALRNAVMQYYQDMKGIPLQRIPPSTSLAFDASGIPQTLKDLQIQPTSAFTSVDANGNPIAFNPVTARGWRGPYLLQSTGAFQPESATPVPGVSLDISFYPTVSGTFLFGTAGDPAFVDGWGNPIVLQWPAVGTGAPTNPSNDFLVRTQYVRLISAGPPNKYVNGNLVSTIDSTFDLMPTMPTAAYPTVANNRGNDILLFILTQDLYP